MNEKEENLIIVKKKNSDNILNIKKNFLKQYEAFLQRREKGRIENEKKIELEN